MTTVDVLGMVQAGVIGTWSFSLIPSSIYVISTTFAFLSLAKWGEGLELKRSIVVRYSL